MGAVLKAVGPVESTAGQTYTCRIEAAKFKFSNRKMASDSKRSAVKVRCCSLVEFTEAASRNSKAFGLILP